MDLTLETKDLVMKNIIAMFAFFLAVCGSLSGCYDNEASYAQTASPTLNEATNDASEKKAMKYRDAMDGVVSYVPPVGANLKPSNTSKYGEAK